VAGCSHWSLHTVNPQVAITLRFAMRNTSLPLDETGQTPYVAVNLGFNDDDAGEDLEGFERRC
jgi:hypothetical protein